MCDTVFVSVSIYAYLCFRRLYCVYINICVGGGCPCGWVCFTELCDIYSLLRCQFIKKNPQYLNSFIFLCELLASIFVFHNIFGEISICSATYILRKFASATTQRYRHTNTHCVCVCLVIKTTNIYRTIEVP